MLIRLFLAAISLRDVTAERDVDRIASYFLSTLCTFSDPFQSLLSAGILQDSFENHCNHLFGNFMP